MGREEQKKIADEIRQLAKKARLLGVYPRTEPDPLCKVCNGNGYYHPDKHYDYRETCACTSV